MGLPLVSELQTKTLEIHRSQVAIVEPSKQRRLQLLPVGMTVSCVHFLSQLTQTRLTEALLIKRHQA